MSSCIAKTRFLNKVVVCTASTQGVGFEIAQRLAQEGAKVVVSSRKKKNVDEAVEKLRSQGLTAIGVVCHVANDLDRKRLLEEAFENFGGIDVLFSNAGVNAHIGPVMECTTKQWDKIFDVNVKSHFLLSQEIIPYFEKRGGGNIVFLSSIGGIILTEWIGAYSVSKTALAALTKTAAYSLAPKNIRVNCIAPGLIETKFADEFMKDPNISKKILDFTALKRYGKVDELNGIAAFIASDDASYITGEVLLVSGGFPSKL